MKWQKNIQKYKVEPNDNFLIKKKLNCWTQQQKEEERRNNL